MSREQRQKHARRLERGEHPDNEWPQPVRLSDRPGPTEPCSCPGGTRLIARWFPVPAGCKTCGGIPSKVKPGGIVLREN